MSEKVLSEIRQRATPTTWQGCDVPVLLTLIDAQQKRIEESVSDSSLLRSKVQALTEAGNELDGQVVADMFRYVRDGSRIIEQDRNYAQMLIAKLDEVGK